MDEEAVAMIGRYRFAQLLQGPLRCGMRRDIDMEQSAASVFDDDKHVEHAEGRRDRDTEVARHNGLGVVAHKRSPALGLQAFARTSVQALRQILAHGSW